MKLQSSIQQLYSKPKVQRRRFSMNFGDFQEHLRAAAWHFTISREVSRYAFLSVGFFKKTLLMKIFRYIFVMSVAK